jgi:hypothetical protein
MTWTFGNKPPLDIKLQPRGPGDRNGNQVITWLVGFSTTLSVSSVEQRMIDKYGKALEATGRGPVEVLSGSVPGGTEENDIMPQLG